MLFIRNKIKDYELLAPILVLILLCVLIGILNHNFFSFRNFIRIANGASIPLILGIGVTFVIIMGSIDLSVEGKSQTVDVGDLIETSCDSLAQHLGSAIKNIVSGGDPEYQPLFRKNIFLI